VPVATAPSHGPVARNKRSVEAVLNAHRLERFLGDLRAEPHPIQIISRRKLEKQKCQDRHGEKRAQRLGDTTDPEAHGGLE
jgi:hypothetical protein